jgi:hypothetical protein
MATFTLIVNTLNSDLNEPANAEVRVQSFFTPTIVPPPAYLSEFRGEIALDQFFNISIDTRPSSNNIFFERWVSTRSSGIVGGLSSTSPGAGGNLNNFVFSGLEARNIQPGETITFTAVYRNVFTPPPSPIQVNISPREAFVLLGNTVLLTASATRDGIPVGDVIFSSQDPNIATVDETTGLVTTRNGGTAIIRARSAADLSRSAAASIRVIVPETPPPPPTFEIAIEPIQQSVLIGQFVQFQGFASEGEVTYQSLNTNIATINQQGIATGISTGSTTIRAISNINSDFFADASLQVVAPPSPPSPTPSPSPSPPPPRTFNIRVFAPVLGGIVRTQGSLIPPGTSIGFSITDGQGFSISAEPSFNFEFVRWDGGDGILFADTIIPDRDYDLTPIFREIAPIPTLPPEATATPTPTPTLTPTPTPTLTPTPTPTLTPTPVPQWRNCTDGKLKTGLPRNNYVSRRFRGPGGGLCFEPASFIGFNPPLDNIRFDYQRAGSQFPSPYGFEVTNPSSVVSYRIMFETNSRFFEVSPKQITIGPSETSQRINISANMQNIDEFGDGFTTFNLKVKVEEV